MTAYGFRLFKVSLRRENGRAPQPWVLTVDGAVKFRLTDHVQKLWSGHVGVAVRGLPHPPAPADEDDNADSAPLSGPIFKITDAWMVGATPAIRVRYGRHGGHDLAMGSPEDPDQGDVDITGLSPSRLHRAALIAPSGQGDGVLAVETVGQACPQRQLLAWFRDWSQASVQRDAAGTTPAWWKLIGNALGDSDQLTAFMASAHAESIQLTGQAIDATRQRRGDDITIGMAVTADGTRRAITGAAKAWGAAVARGEPIPSRGAATAVAAIIGMENAAFEYDDARITVRDTDGRTRVVRPSQLSDVFTYWICEDVPPTDHVWLARVRGAVEHLQATAELEVNWDQWPPGTP